MVSEEFRRAGQRFVSARYLSQRFKISYQTAHRLLTELEGDGLIIRRARFWEFHRGSEETAAIRSLDFRRASKAFREFR